MNLDALREKVWYRGRARVKNLRALLPPIVRDATPIVGSTLTGGAVMSITVEARYQACQLLLEQPLSLPEGQRVRVTIEPIDDAPVGQQIVAQWRKAGVIGAWATRLRGCRGKADLRTAGSRSEDCTCRLHPLKTDSDIIGT